MLVAVVFTLSLTSLLPFTGFLACDTEDINTIKGQLRAISRRMLVAQLFVFSAIAIAELTVYWISRINHGYNAVLLDPLKLTMFLYPLASAACFCKPGFGNVKVKIGSAIVVFFISMAGTALFFLLRHLFDVFIWRDNSQFSRMTLFRFIGKDIVYETGLGFAAAVGVVLIPFQYICARLLPWLLSAPSHRLISRKPEMK